MTRKLFGTDGVRGRANSAPMTADTALKLGAAAGRYFRRDGSSAHRVVIGKDTRLSGYMFENALTGRICVHRHERLSVGPGSYARRRYDHHLNARRCRRDDLGQS